MTGGWVNRSAVGSETAAVVGQDDAVGSAAGGDAVEGHCHRTVSAAQADAHTARYW